MGLYPAERIQLLTDLTCLPHPDQVILILDLPADKIDDPLTAPIRTGCRIIAGLVKREYVN